MKLMYLSLMPSCLKSNTIGNVLRLWKPRINKSFWGKSMRRTQKKESKSRMRKDSHPRTRRTNFNWSRLRKKEMKRPDESHLSSSKHCKTTLTKRKTWSKSLNRKNSPNVYSKKRNARRSPWNSKHKGWNKRTCVDRKSTIICLICVVKFSRIKERDCNKFNLSMREKP